MEMEIPVVRFLILLKINFKIIFIKTRLYNFANFNLFAKLELKFL